MADAITPVNVVVVFYCRDGLTESLALRTGVGAVQARANIRLRRLADPDPAQDFGPAHKQMLADYIAPRQIDAEWADLFLIASPADDGVMAGYLRTLEALKLQHKTAGVITPAANIETPAGFSSIIRQQDEEPVDFGRRAALSIRQQKNTASV